MDIDDLQKQWSLWGEEDPLYSILSKADKKGGKWNPDEFFEHGKLEISRVMEHVNENYGAQRAMCLDFGCGAGRLTQALCDHFDHGVGVDIAQPMIELAKQFNRHGDRCAYVHNTRPNLHVLKDKQFDLIYTNLVLQHMQTQYQKGYIEEFIERLSPDGLAIFQVPSHPSARADDFVGWGVIEEAPSVNTTNDIEKKTPTLLPFRIKPLLKLDAQPMPANRRVVVTVDTVYLGTQAWESADQIPCALVANWYDEKNNLVRFEDSITSMGSEIELGRKKCIDLLITTPPYPGRYTLEMYVTEDPRNWCQLDREDAFSVTIDVAGSKKEIRDMEMHATPMPQVLQWIEASGGTLREIVETKGSHAWVCYQYYVQRA